MGNSGAKENDQNSTGSMIWNDFDTQAAEAATMLESQGGMSSKLQLSLSCKDLANLDVGSLSDPFCVVYMRFSADEPWAEYDRTEIIANTLNPQWVTLINVPFYFEQVQYMKFEIYDVPGDFSSSDSSKQPLEKNSLLGKAECALALIVGSRAQTWVSPLECSASVREKAENQSVLHVKAEESPNSSMMLDLEFQLAGLSKDKSNPFLRVLRTSEHSDPVPCYRTEVIDNKVTSTFKAAKVPLSQLANGDLFRPLIVQAFSYKVSGAHKYIGEVRLSVQDMLNMAETKQKKPLISEAKKAKGKGYQDSGFFIVKKASSYSEPTFFEYLAGGMQMQFMVAIDYTGSNLDPSQTNSLHYRDPKGRVKNQYVRAIESVGRTIEFFDDDKRFPVWGFGGQCKPSEPASHCFPLTGDENNPEVVGVEGILEAYHRSFDWVRLSGPTLFAPIVTQAASIAESSMYNQRGKVYYTLLILTDGQIMDMDNTIEAIVKGADAPFSIIIVGVGKEDFSSMDILDGDEERLTNGAGKKASRGIAGACRDIVQFVPFREFENKSPQALAKEVLAEIPGQVVDFMKQKGIKPGKPTAHGGGGSGGSLRDVMQSKQQSFKEGQQRRKSSGGGSVGGGGDAGMRVYGGGDMNNSTATAPPPPPPYAPQSAYGTID